jgi:hypothetical protein
MLTKSDKIWMIELLYSFAYFFLDARLAGRWRTERLDKVESE